MIPQDMYEISRYENITDGIDHLGLGDKKIPAEFRVDAVFRDLRKIGVIRLEDFRIMEDCKISVESTSWSNRDYYITFGCGIKERMTTVPGIARYTLYLKP